MFNSSEFKLMLFFVEYISLGTVKCDVSYVVRESVISYTDMKRIMFVVRMGFIYALAYTSQVFKGSPHLRQE